MAYIEFEVEESLNTALQGNAILVWIESLWQSRLTSLTYQALYNLLKHNQYPVNFLVDRGLCHYDNILLLQRVLGNIFPVGRFLDRPEASHQRLCKIILCHPSSLQQISTRVSMEKYSELTAVCIYNSPILPTFVNATYEQRIGLPYSSGKRDGVSIKNYTSRIFLPSVSEADTEILIGDEDSEQNWIGIPRFHGGLRITKRVTLNTSLYGVSVYSGAGLDPGYYALEARVILENSASTMLNLHARIANHKFLDCQVMISDKISPNQAIDQLFADYDGSMACVVAYFKLSEAVHSFSVKWFLGPQIHSTHSSSLLIRNMSLFSVKEEWGH